LATYKMVGWDYYMLLGSSIIQHLLRPPSPIKPKTTEKWNRYIKRNERSRIPKITIKEREFT
jgi:hypothetical protein